VRIVPQVVSRDADSQNDQGDDDFFHSISDSAGYPACVLSVNVNFPVAPSGNFLRTPGVECLRRQDTGDPRDHGAGGTAGNNHPSNRKIYFGHNIGSDIDPVKAQTIMRSGVTLTFRARIPTLAKAGPPLDSLYRDGQQAMECNPTRQAVTTRQRILATGPR